MASATGTLLRERGHHDSSRVSMVELFFDLVFVFAVTQLSHTLLEHLTPLGAAQTALLLPAIWWVWIYTSWVTNWLNPGTHVRAALACSCSCWRAWFSPHRYRTRSQNAALVFACAYVAMQMGRTVVHVVGDPRRPPVDGADFPAHPGLVPAVGYFLDRRRLRCSVGTLRLVGARDAD